VDHREQRKLRRRLRATNLRRQASLENIDWHSPRRGLDKAQVHSLATCAWPHAERAAPAGPPTQPLQYAK
jgi:hypothetical protein